MLKQTNSNYKKTYASKALECGRNMRVSRKILTSILFHQLGKERFNPTKACNKLISARYYLEARRSRTRTLSR